MSGYDFNDPSFLFLDILSLVERLHRRLLDVIKNHLEAIGKNDLNPVQALLIYNIGENEMTAGELKTRGYYQGSNVSYNLKKLVEMGYLRHERSDYDRRAVRISLTDQGYDIRKMVDELYQKHLEELMHDDLINHEELKSLRKNLRNLERFWSDKIHFGL
ncbi:MULTISPECIES: MarR family winged helix-turn-helix transcriptional regulator [Kordiimonas]|uniref:MarR family winged helix-turn-helix transcriptional regulator n=1 Tax=Kordiimonas TaxID=288021 RepID=UPI001FF65054|nr:MULTISPECIES: winged helix DNA-binding protein [Kordiimonas]MCK0070416.1 winged helix DNA-binding protein [Kordiimonas laminariae]UTW57559.1 winged helix DNA-binding protein [Kordiimonas sp. SCSIO 12603]